jgi:hypothetical protein
MNTISDDWSHYVVLVSLWSNLEYDNAISAASVDDILVVVCRFRQVRFDSAYYTIEDLKYYYTVAIMTTCTGPCDNKISSSACSRPKVSAR